MGLLEEIEKHRSLINELRHRMKGHLSQKMFDDDVLFYRFLVARSFNLRDAETMLLNDIKWRKVNRVDTIISDFQLPEVAKYTPFSALGAGRDGIRTLYFDFGNFDAKGFLKSIKKDDILKMLILIIEQELKAMDEANEKREKPIYQVYLIINFEHFSLTSATHRDVLDVFISIVELYESHYPERFCRGFYINASYYFSLAWMVVKPFFSPNTRDKIKIYGKDDWQDDFAAVFDQDMLPAFLGGNRTDPDGNPMCNTFIVHGGKIPESYYVDQDKTKLSAQQGVKRVQLKRRSAAEVLLHVAKPGSTIEWEFQVNQRNIGFQLCYRPSTGQEEEDLIPDHKVDTSFSAEKGMLKCDSVQQLRQLGDKQRSGLQDSCNIILSVN